jgi:diaminopimelate epimerase
MNEEKGIPFTKATACGNDFLIVDTAQVEGLHTKASLRQDKLGVLTRRMCDRHNGVGADGVEWLFPDGEADAMARLFNADSSEAEISGNGTRCVAAELYCRNAKPEILIRTVAGVKTCRLIAHEGHQFEFETDMGEPIVGEQLAVEIAGMRTVGMRVSMGNPHYVVFVNEFPDDWQGRGARIVAQPVFSQGTNVEFVTVRARNEIEIRLFERGVGETQSSGTGSCASAVAAIASGRVSSPVRVIAPGGAQTVRWQDRVFLQGPATIICRGEFFV